MLHCVDGGSFKHKTVQQCNNNTITIQQYNSRNICTHLYEFKTKITTLLGKILLNTETVQIHLMVFLTVHRDITV